jgi:hypothetical protein
MMSMRRWLPVLCGIALGLGTTTPARATPKAANVPPGLEIAVLDPNVDPQGRPAIQMKAKPGLAGTREIDIPPAVLVHRFYYTGDRSFQAQLLPGGPCIVVVNHPKTAERLYIPVQMPPGAPRVIYTAHAIEYDFGKHGVTIQFGLFACPPKVEYRNCMTIARRLENTSDKVSGACQEFADRAGITAAKQKVSSASKNACKDTADLIGAVGRGIVTPVVQLGKLLPGAQMLCTTEEDRATRLRDSQVRTAENAAASQGLTIPSNR